MTKGEKKKTTTSITIKAISSIERCYHGLWLIFQNKTCCPHFNSIYNY